MFCVKEFQCSKMGELNQIRSFDLKIYDHCIFALGIQRSFVKPYLVHPSGF